MGVIGSSVEFRFVPVCTASLETAAVLGGAEEQLPCSGGQSWSVCVRSSPEDGRMMQFDRASQRCLCVFGEKGSAFCGCCSLGPVPAVGTAHSQLVFKEINIS